MPHNIVPKIDLTMWAAPDYSEDNPYVFSGYRSRMSYVQCLYSMFQWHNQTLNIWTSVFNVAINVGGYMWYVNDTDTNYAFAFHVGLRAVCWFFSWAYHTFAPQSRYTSTCLCKMDYIGCYLTPLGMGTHLLQIDPVLRLAPWNNVRYGLQMVGAFCILGSMGLSLLPKYMLESYRICRMGLSIICVLPYLVGMCIGFICRPTPEHMYLVYALTFELAAGAFYVSMIPEKYVPYTFDCACSSHTLWHILNAGFDVCIILYCVHII